MSSTVGFIFAQKTHIKNWNIDVLGRVEGRKLECLKRIEEIDYQQ